MKKVLSVLLSIVMLFSVMAGMSLTAEAVGNYGVDLTSAGYNSANIYKNPPQCTWYCWGRAYEKLGISLPGWGNAISWDDNADANPNYTVGTEARANSIMVENSASPGHVMFVEKVENGYAYITEGNYSGSNYHEDRINLSTMVRDSWKSHVLSPCRYIYLSGGSQTITGTEMSSGYEREIPDGHFLIANAGTTDKTSYYYLDINGTAKPAENGTNVILTGPLKKDPPSYEIWDLKYSNGFYTIKQTGTDVSLDVWNKDNRNGANIGVSSFNGGSNQKWAISKNGRNGYRIQSKSTGFSVDVKDGGTNTGTNIQQCVNNSTDAQSWMFIPYNPSQTLAEGRYIIISALSDSLEIDIPGDTGNVEENTNVQVWSDIAQSRYNSFNVKKLNNGYYKIIHNASGKSLDVSNAISTYCSNIALHTSNDSVAQQWAITKDGYNGGYVIWAKCSGLVADVAGESTSNGTNVMQHPYNGHKNQTWKFVKAEYSIKYNANGGTNAPSAQTKYYKSDLTISSAKPTRNGYNFINWNTKADGSGTSYSAGSTYKNDSDITLYAQWEKNNCSHTWNSGTVTLPATCTEEGTKTYTCTACGETKTKTIKPTGHLDETVKGTPATFKAAGKTDGKKCKVCGKITVAQKSIAKLGSPKLSNVKAGKKQFKASWKAVKNIGGYQIQYSTDKSFKKGNKTVTVKGYKSNSKTVKSLKAKKKYYVRIRAYKTINGKKQYSSWSSKKSVTTKK